MAVQYGVVNDPIEVSDRYELHGTAKKRILVVEGGILLLHGTCEDDVVVESGGEAYIYGVVQGSVANQGGLVEVHGLVHGDVQKEDEQTTIDPDAEVKGEVV